MYNKYVLLYFRVRFAIGVDHVDYVTIKKRIQVCTTITPTLDKLIDRYFTLYKKWSNQRFVYIFEITYVPRSFSRSRSRSSSSTPSGSM